MNQELAGVIKAYATYSHNEFTKLLADKSKDSIAAVLVDLLTLYFNDKNSSTLRQYIVVTLSGYEPNYKKIGYNGYRQISVDSDTPEYCEAKPKNIDTNDENPRRLNGGGNFTDYSWSRFEKDKDKNPIMIVGGFIDGKLIHIFKFAFNSPTFTARLEDQLKRYSPNGHVAGHFLRSASFGLNHYRDAPSLDVKVFVDAEELAKLKAHMTPTLYAFLNEHLK